MTTNSPAVQVAPALIAVRWKLAELQTTNGKLRNPLVGNQEMKGYSLGAMERNVTWVDLFSAENPEAAHWDFRIEDGHREHHRFDDLRTLDKRK